MSVRDLFIQAPHLSGAHWAEQHAEWREHIWRIEMEKMGFGRKPGRPTIERIAFAFDFSCEKEDVKEYCKDLTHLCMLRHYELEHDDKEAKAEADDLYAVLEPREVNFPTVAAKFTVAQANGGWWGE
jgi:hypothetical protein